MSMQNPTRKCGNIVMLIIAKRWKQHECPQTEKWINKLWCIYQMEYYSAIKKN